MKERKQAIEMCLTFSEVYEDYPFDDNWTAMRHNDNKKVFAFIYQHCGQMLMNIKVIPEEGAYLRQHYDSVRIAYHVNKMHWITIVLDDSIADEEIKNWLTTSYELTKSKATR